MTLKLNDYIKSLAKEHYCVTEYDIGGKHECYEFSEAELIEFAKTLVWKCTGEQFERYFDID